MAAVLLLIISVGSAQIGSSNYNITTIITEGGDNNTVVGIISGTAGSDNFSTQLGFFYGLNVAPDNPNPVVNFSGVENISSEKVICSSVLADDDGNSLDVSVRWYLNGGLNLTIDYGSISGGSFSAMLLSGNTTKHNNWSCGMRVFDGMLYSDWVNASANVTVLNDIPTVTLLTPGDASATTNRTPLFSWTGYDADGDSLEYEWSINASKFSGLNTCSDFRTVSNIDGLSYVPTSVLECLHDNGYNYQWRVRAEDSEGFGEWSDTFTVNISADVTITLTLDEIDFGSMASWDENDTSDDNPSPFELQNDGNSVVNISLNSSALWDNEPTDSDKYQFKIDETGETGAFAWLSSITNWFNMPITGNIVAIHNLSYVDSKDSVEIDLRVDSPSEEPGAKSAMIIITSSLSEGQNG